jgi:hypothetical protein
MRSVIRAFLVLAVLTLGTSTHATGQQLATGRPQEDWFAIGASQNPITIQIEDKLGVSAQLQVSYVVCSEERDELPTPNNQFLQMRGSGGVSYAIPLAILDEARLLGDGRHSVRVRSGFSVDGTGCGSLEDWRNSERKYPLNQIVTMKAVRPAPSSRPPMTSTDLWFVQCAERSSAPARLIRPSFGFRHRDTYRRVEGVFYDYATAIFSGRSTAFKIQTGAETLTANMADFTTIDLIAGDVPRVTVTARNGRTTSGDLILLKEGEPVAVSNWYLMGVIPDSGGVVALIEKPSCSLSRLAPSAR